MLAVFVNMITVFIGSIVGIIFKNNLSKKYERVVFISAGIISLTIGISMAIITEHILIFAISIMLGGLTGTMLSIEEKIESFGKIIKKTFSFKDNAWNFSLGFLTSSILFCSGSMAIVGSFQAGTNGNYDLIFTKSVIDGFVAIFMTTVYGIGVAFSVISIFVYQGALTLLSSFLEPYVSQTMLNEVSAVGGATVMMIGLNLLNITKIKTGDFLPALIYAIFLVLVIPYISFL
ncbi:hypothetical protein BPP43_02030 [Brachyspira pilosicoli P43/6/78]|uniref:Transport protein n=1 Tax=Brachyspira pilosicoli P43/6/78 TaxID=1042417 RepID=A0A3B6VIH8_BRAPL|nr:DUF554 domain-containing protein [Brachyspira pilosicoli]AGA65736.1 hypothetical protein BPP43_02030 [Brachyspira pilosicoli P43/6/78]